jgi:hypothetical protein
LCPLWPGELTLAASIGWGCHSGAIFSFSRFFLSPAVFLFSTFFFFSAFFLFSAFFHFFGGQCQNASHRHPGEHPGHPEHQVLKFWGACGGPGQPNGMH